MCSQANEVTNFTSFGSDKTPTNITPAITENNIVTTETAILGMIE